MWTKRTLLEISALHSSHLRIREWTKKCVGIWIKLTFDGPQQKPVNKETIEPKLFIVLLFFHCYWLFMKVSQACQCPTPGGAVKRFSLPKRLLIGLQQLGVMQCGQWFTTFSLAKKIGRFSVKGWFPLSRIFRADGILHNKRFVIRNILFNFTATFSLVNKTFPVRFKSASRVDDGKIPPAFKLFKLQAFKLLRPKGNPAFRPDEHGKTVFREPPF